MTIPNGHRAVLGNKLEEYVLNPLHREGRHKAHMFESALGITLHNAHLLRQALLVAAADSEDAAPRGDNGFGQTWVLRTRLETPLGAGTLLSAWIIRHGEDFPRLTTCYLL